MQKKDSFVYFIGVRLRTVASGASPSLRTWLILTGIVCAQSCYITNANVKFIDESF